MQTMKGSLSARATPTSYPGQRVPGRVVDGLAARHRERRRCPRRADRRLPRTIWTLTGIGAGDGPQELHRVATTDVSVYFCDPRSPWQRGTSENTNRLLGQYLPRRTDLSVYDQGDLDLIALKLNTRPRKTLGYDTPAATLAKTVALTG